VVIAFRQQIQRMGERPRARAIAVAGERLTQGVERTAVLQQQGRRHRIDCDRHPGGSDGI
jgi:hypothetical protein